MEHNPLLLFLAVLLVVGFFWRTLDRAGASHVYLSTACLHGEHARCQRQCRFCSAYCRCACHASPVEPSPRDA